ncbi:MAG TPA: TIGR03557 family F420-dependent LLM class oxidoreductase [Phenylobacterium sp.]|uniref:TIGR03557 family F420-dependent LLM class oxidoreductase n=1 Tax=Phenylobacterium sp. TaxID=1871053 RepID=UPI002B4A86A4|nr:TIGR03557 family F420-dependent LLM class oxidoreductase [Phenylobacterium sp.]HKR86968.1 TIGR03557 family F420-dependent LLM class oxidoreductase [Phenylobacterium sp.]
MVKFGYKLMTEEHGPKALVANAQRAEAAGFDFVSISDHFHPWLEIQGHAPFAWSVLGAIAAVTSRMGVTTGLTCPIIRYHPAIIAQAAATIAVMSEGRFSLAIGAGERLNEHVTGARWPSIPERHEMLGEAIDIFRTLWKGGAHTWRGKHFQIDHARLYDLPDRPITVTLGVSGPHGVALAAEKADGVMATEPQAKLVQDYLAKTKTPGPRYAECTLAYADSEQKALEMLRERFRFGALGWSAMSEIPTVKGFEAASRYVRKEDLKDGVGLGPDVESHLAAIRQYVEAGFDHVVLLGVGPDQASFIDFFERSLKPRLDELAAKA